MRSSRRHRGLIFSVLLVFVAGCPRDSDTPPKRRRTTVRVRSYTEATQVSGVAGVPPYAFSATARGLDRWDMRTGKGLLLTGDHGLPGDQVLATALDRGRGWLWVATDGGVTRYDIEDGVFTGIPPAPTDALTALVADTRALAPAGKGGVWIGSAEGLAYTDSSGDWKAAGFDQPVNALARDRNGNLWIGTAAKGLAVRRPDGAFESFASDPNCVIRSVRFIVPAADGAAVAVGEDSMGQQRISMVRDGVCASFRATPNELWLGATPWRDEVVVMTRRKLYSLSVGKHGARRLQRDGMNLVSLAPGTDTERSRSPYRVGAFDVRVPSGANSIAASGDALLIGTADLGTAVIDLDADRTRWLRRGELVGAGESISVACIEAKMCFVATGGQGVWRFDGTTFHQAGGGDARVLAVAMGPRGGAYALFRISDDPRIRVARVDGPDGWQELDDLEIVTPGRRASLAFAKTSPRGTLWLGLRYIDDDGEDRAHGAAEVDLRHRRVEYHRVSYGEAEEHPGVLPIPLDLTDVAFLGRDEIWLGSREGVVQVQGKQVRIYTESEGLVSELVRGVAARRALVEPRAAAPLGQRRCHRPRRAALDGDAARCRGLRWCAGAPPRQAPGAARGQDLRHSDRQVRSHLGPERRRRQRHHAVECRRRRAVHSPPHARTSALRTASK